MTTGCTGGVARGDATMGGGRRRGSRPTSAPAGGPGVVVVVVVPVALGGAATGTGLRVQFSLKCREVGVRAEVLQLAGDLRLLGLGSAAPHGVTPSCVCRGGIAGRTAPREGSSGVAERLREWCAIVT